MLQLTMVTVCLYSSSHMVSEKTRRTTSSREVGVFYIPSRLGKCLRRTVRIGDKLYNNFFFVCLMAYQPSYAWFICLMAYQLFMLFNAKAILLEEH